MTGAPFEPQGGRETSPTTWEWPCGCIAHSFEGEMTVKPCSIEHDDPLEEFVLATVEELGTNPEIERVYVDLGGSS